MKSDKYDFRQVPFKSSSPATCSSYGFQKIILS